MLVMIPFHKAWHLHAGITIAIDDRYEVWGSGIISIPWNFRMQDLKPQILKLLGPAVAQQPAPSGRTAQASFQSYTATQFVSSNCVTGFASRDPSYRLPGLRQYANGPRQRVRSSVSRRRTSYVLHTVLQPLNCHAVPVCHSKHMPTHCF